MTSDRITELAELEHALWLDLLCMCNCCDRHDDYPAPIKPADNPTEWARIVAPLAYADGWTAPGVCFLLCPDCRARGVDWQKLYSPPPDGGIPLDQREAFQRAVDGPRS